MIAYKKLIFMLKSNKLCFLFIVVAILIEFYELYFLNIDYFSMTSGDHFNVFALSKLQQFCLVCIISMLVINGIQSVKEKGLIKAICGIVLSVGLALWDGYVMNRVINIYENTCGAEVINNAYVRMLDTISNDFQNYPKYSKFIAEERYLIDGSITKYMSENGNFMMYEPTPENVDYYNKQKKFIADIQKIKNRRFRNVIFWILLPIVLIIIGNIRRKS